MLRWGFFHSRACGRHIQPNTVPAPDGAIASPSACARTALSSLISPGCVGAPRRRRFQTTTDVARTLLRTRHHFNKENSQSGFLLFEISSPSLKSAALGVIDMQNAFVAEGATYETPPARTMLPNLERIINFARTRTNSPPAMPNSVKKRDTASGRTLGPQGLRCNNFRVS